MFGILKKKKKMNNYPAYLITAETRKNLLNGKMVKIGDIYIALEAAEDKYILENPKYTVFVAIWGTTTYFSWATYPLKVGDEVLNKGTFIVSEI